MMALTSIQALQIICLAVALICIAYLWWLLDRDFPSQIKETILEITKLKTWKSPARWGIFAGIMSLILSPLGSFFLGLVGILTTAGSIYMATKARQRLTLMNILRELQIGETALVQIPLSSSKGLKTEIWFRHTGEAWPPVRMELGVEQFLIRATDAPTEILEHFNKSLEEKPDLQPLLQKLTEALQKKGITHFLDIEGVTVLDSIRTWMQDHLNKA